MHGQGRVDIHSYLNSSPFKYIHSPAIKTAAKSNKLQHTQYCILLFIELKFSLSI